MKRSLVISGILLLGSILTASAQIALTRNVRVPTVLQNPQDVNFTFYVPVELHKINPNIPSFAVSISVFDQAGTVIASQASQLIDLVNGEFNAVVAVQFNADPGKDPAMGTNYRTNLWFHLNGPPSEEKPAVEAMASTGACPFDASQPFSPYVEGFLQAPLPTSQPSGAQGTPGTGGTPGIAGPGSQNMPRANSGPPPMAPRPK